jgi:hypothetical protein
LITNIVAAVIIVALGSLISHLTGRVTQWVVLGVGVYALFSWAKSLAVRDPVTYAMIFRCKSMIYVNLAYPYYYLHHLRIRAVACPVLAAQI